jgi:hypothetical protein
MKARVFGVDWLRNGMLVRKDAVAADDLDEAAAVVREREPRMLSVRRSERRPDSFRLIDAAAKILGTFRVLTSEPSD